MDTHPTRPDRTAVSRRNFLTLTGGALTLAMVSGPMFLLEGCGVSATIARGIINGFNSILTYLKNSGITTNNILLQAARTALAAFSDAYNAWNANQNAGTLAALGAAAEAALNDVQSFLAATDLGGTIAQIVLALAEVVISSLETFLPNVMAESVRLHSGQTLSSVPPVKRTLPQFISAFNTVCKSYGHNELRIK